MLSPDPLIEERWIFTDGWEGMGRGEGKERDGRKGKSKRERME